MKKCATILIMTLLLLTTGCTKAESPREKFQKQLNQQLQQLDQKLGAMQAKFAAKLADLKKTSDEQAAEAQKQFDEAMAGVKEKQEAAKRALLDLKFASGEEWEKAKEKATKAEAELKKAYEDAAARLK
jgi:DNA anti-recombination protein RmuC